MGTLVDLMIPFGNDIYYSAGFMAMIEDHMTYLRNHSKTTVTAVSPQQAYEYVGNMQGLMLELNIPTHLHFTVLRMNDFTNYLDSDETITSLLVPNESVISRLLSGYNTQNSLE